MKIKKIELSGFKSFVDRTVIHLDHDVLGIVGPNGCGKSNIVDAIRWCMGEQSARHLRGRSMDDVIFSGSESRAAHEFAEVTLTFENDRPEDVPLEFKQYAEIAVTRRLHRTGESDYLINKTSVRLRDVTDLFLGTGAGTKAYSIVEQGKVGLIVSAKPEDRRALIEEAAGITKFKSRKKQAEKKMELTQQNLLRVSDIVAEIERNLASLKRQAAKAERFIAYRNELEDLRLYEASHRYLELVGWCKLEAGEVDRLSQTGEEARVELETRDRDVEGARAAVLEAEQTFEAAQSASHTAEGAARAEEAAVARARDRIGSLAQREEQASAERRSLGEQAAQLAQEHEACLRDIAVIEEVAGRHAERTAEEERKLADFGGAQSVASARVGDRKQAIAKGRAEIAGAEAKLAGLDRRQQEASARTEKIRVERESLDQERADNAGRARDLKAAVEDLRAGRVLTAAEKTKLEQRLGELRGQLGGCERRHEEVKGELSKRRSRLGALEEMHARLEGVGAGTKALVGTKDACIVGLVADRIEAPPELTQALAGLLGVRLQDVVVRDADRAVALLEELARARRGRAAIVPLRAPFIAGGPGDGAAPADEDVVGRLADALRFSPEDEALVRNLVGDAIVVRNLTCARRLQAAGVRAPLVTLDGAVVHADGRISGGQGDALAAGMLESKREARALAKQIQQLDAQAAERLAELKAMREEIARTGAALDRARQEAHDRDLATLTAEKDLQKTEERLAAVERRAASLDGDAAEWARVIAQARAERDEVARSLSEAGARVEAAEGELREAEAALAEAADRVESQRRALTACKVEAASTSEKLGGMRGTAARLSRSVVELEGRAKRLDEELVANARALAETQAELASREGGLREMLDRAARAAEALVEARTEFERARAALVEREAGLKELRARFDATRGELQRHELALRERQLAHDHLVASVAERFRGLRLAMVVGDYHMRPPPDDVSRARADELSRLIDRMGSVNLDAMREHAENEQRFGFYTTQKADLEKALADLTRAIQQMNRESRKLFQETFEAVNARFREIFPRMFRGGRAELRMTDPEDLLETGIDIVAQPPGKRLSSIELMSGGEKALTAVSLIFAIFQIRPSPFCILDEVDAPLDEANVARYNEMIRSMTDRSQFILITHIKRTMQLVDALYGVTMAEPGVSRIVSVKINDSSANRSAPPEAAVA